MDVHKPTNFYRSLRVNHWTSDGHYTVTVERARKPGDITKTRRYTPSGASRGRLSDLLLYYTGSAQTQTNIYFFDSATVANLVAFTRLTRGGK